MKLLNATQIAAKQVAQSLSSCVSTFIASLDLDGDTKRAYELDLIAFQVFLQGDPPVDKVTREQLKIFLESMKTKSGKRVSISTQNRRYASLRRFFSWLVVEEYLESSPFQNIARRRPNKDCGELPSGSVMRALNKNLVHQIIQNTKQLRDKVLFTLIYTTGLRISEALLLNVEDINDDIITVRLAKGNKPRRAFVSQALRPLLRKYIKELGYDTGLLFPSPRNKVKPLSYGRARQLFQNSVGDLRNSDGSAITIHQLRHTFATERVGHIDSILLMDLMGHSDIRTTLRYAKAMGKASHDAYVKFDSWQDHEWAKE